MNTDKTSIENESQPSCLGAVMPSLPHELIEWWEGFRPESWNITQHLQNPCINCPTEREKKLALWISVRLLGNHT
jgi:hypothetical protein